MREASDYGKVGGYDDSFNPFKDDFAKVKFDIANIQFRNLFISDSGSIGSNPSTHKISEYCLHFAEEKTNQLQQQIKDQQELIDILLDRLESNDPYYNKFLEEEKLTQYKNKYQ